MNSSCPMDQMFISTNFIGVILIMRMPPHLQQRLYCNQLAALCHDVTEEGSLRVVYKNELSLHCQWHTVAVVLQGSPKCSLWVWHHASSVSSFEFDCPNIPLMQKHLSWLPWGSLCWPVWSCPWEVRRPGLSNSWISSRELEWVLCWKLLSKIWVSIRPRTPVTNWRPEHWPKWQSYPVPKWQSIQEIYYLSEEPFQILPRIQVKVCLLTKWESCQEPEWKCIQQLDWDSFWELD